MVRLIVAWLVMAALPLQGLAAASMLFCHQAAHSTVLEGQGAHDHGAHGDRSGAHQADGHDHASHNHGQVADAGSGSGSDSEVAHASQGAAEGSAVDGHACPICASCCNLVALPEPLSLSLAADSPAAQPLHEPARVITRDSPAPDKPPRA
jgi:hypothetical protein